VTISYFTGHVPIEYCGAMIMLDDTQISEAEYIALHEFAESLIQQVNIEAEPYQSLF
jgi:hypothetical protein